MARQRARLQKITLQRLETETGSEIDQIPEQTAQDTEPTIRRLQTEPGRIAPTSRRRIRTSTDGIRLGPRRRCLGDDWEGYLPLSAASHTVLRS